MTDTQAKLLVVFLYLVVLPGAFVLSYWLTWLTNHPTGIWFWRDMLGLL